MTSHTKFFTFRQNNSGGVFVVNDKVAHSVVVEATSPADANKRAKDMGMFRMSFCECCGPRFFEAFDNEAGTDTFEEAVADARHSHFDNDASVVVHFKDGTSKTF